MNREEYLQLAVQEIKPLFENKGWKVPDVKVSCSWPGGGSARKRIGECWPRSASEANINEIFITPSLDEPLQVLAVLVHELIHAVDDCEHGHRKEFTAIMRDVGLKGKPTATVASESLNAELQKVVDKVGEYPHHKLNLSDRKKQTTRMIKIECLECGAVWRMSQQWASNVTECPCCKSDDFII